MGKPRRKSTVKLELNPLWRAGQILRENWLSILFRWRKAHKDTKTGIVEVYGRDGLVLRYKIVSGRAIIL